RRSSAVSPGAGGDHGRAPPAVADRVRDAREFARCHGRPGDGGRNPLDRPLSAVSRERHASLSAQHLGVQVGTRTLVRDLSFDIAPGEFVAILGRNGSGKTLTLHTLAGLRPPSGGTVLMEGMPLARMGRRAVARQAGFLAQDLEDAFVTTVLESVLIGRHPHLSLWEWESDA